MRATRPITLVVYDEHLMCLEGLAAALDEDPTVAIVAITTRREDLPDILDQRRPDVCLVDVTTPDSACAHDLGALARRSPATAVVAIVDDVPANFARHVVGAGVRGFARRDASLRSLRQTIGRVAAGHAVGAPDLTRRGVTRPAPSGPRTQLSHAAQTVDRLTDREREVLERMMTGEDTRHIAVALDISRSTARTHVQNVRRKLGARTKLQAVAVALGTVVLPSDDVPSRSSCGRR